MKARVLVVNGVVQGVGFRPHAARCARKLGVAGRVKNATDGVHIHIEHESEAALDAFRDMLEKDAPAASRIVSIRERKEKAEGLDGFSIEESTRESELNTLVSPDLATCDECLAELFDESDRRYRYPFINCTNCGTRFTIIERLPYDRAATSMKDFEMCPQCGGEYTDIENRRYHAQPDACFECGPRLWLADAHGLIDGVGGDKDSAPAFKGGALTVDEATLGREESDALIAAAARALRCGKIVAVKGLGGWHLACDATNEKAVTRLRIRKHRPTKPLAILVKDVEAASAIAYVSDAESRVLTGKERPIVLLRRRPDTNIAETVAKDLPEIGVMLPSTPVQHLLLASLDIPLIMTSGNMHGEPIVATDEDALTKLSGIADLFLGNNRAIVSRYDDSVMRVMNDASSQMVRRARGFAPAPLFLDADNPRTAAALSPAVSKAPTPSCLFAAGAEQKATFAFGCGERVYVSQHIGDIESFGSWEAYRQAKDRYESLFDLSADALACDLHPEYISSKWARKQAQELGLPLVEVQHHHAHIASVMGEHALYGRVIGVALDGTGYGEDSTIWGGEVLIAERSSYERFWHLPVFPLLGGKAAVTDPKRCAYALMCDAQGSNDPVLAFFSADNPRCRAFLERLDEADALDELYTSGINSPLCSSAGRIFDAAAAILGLCDKPSYDGEAACLLEAQAHRELREAGTSISDWAQELALAQAQGAWECPQDITPSASDATALDLHKLVVLSVVDQCKAAREKTSENRVTLSGGCMLNRLLYAGLTKCLAREGFEVYTNRELPPTDGCIAYGQIIVARARLLGQ